jgi:hypothetical protein
VRSLLMARGMTSGACGMAWNIDRPEDVKPSTMPTAMLDRV